MSRPFGSSPSRNKKVTVDKFRISRQVEIEWKKDFDERRKVQAVQEPGPSTTVQRRESGLHLEVVRPDGGRAQGLPRSQLCRMEDVLGSVLG